MQCFVHYNVLTVHKCSDNGLFSHLSNSVFCSLYFEKKIIYEAHIFSKYSKLYADFGNAGKSSENIFLFSDNSI